MVPVGDPGNAADTRYRAGGIGSVAHFFQLGATEVTNAEYVEFLNSVAKSDPYLLFKTDLGGIIRHGSAGDYSYSVKPDPSPGAPTSYYANKPVAYVNWYDALRFVNWLHNGQGNGDTETGAYTLGPWDFVASKPAGAINISRNQGARWFLPNEDEWYKAAYYDADVDVYYDYPTGTNVVPNNNYPDSDTGNSGNFYHNGFATETLFDVGAYTLSASPQGTFDQGGNVWEWTETPLANTTPANAARIVRGESSFDIFSQLGHAFRSVDRVSWSQFHDVGFRVASNIPEPSTLPFAISAFVTLLGAHRKARLTSAGGSSVRDRRAECD